MKMKLVTVLLFITLAFAGDSPNFKDVLIKQMNKVKKIVAMECAVENPVDNDTMRQVMTHSGVPDQKVAKCWLRCVLQSMGIIANGKVEWKKGAELNKMAMTTASDKEKIDKVYRICEKEVPKDEKDECQLAYNVAVCKIKYGKELGLPGGTWED